MEQTNIGSRPKKESKRGRDGGYLYKKNLKEKEETTNTRLHNN